MDVNEIFRDLGTMIHEQGEMIGKSKVNVFTKVKSISSLKSSQ